MLTFQKNQLLKDYSTWGIGGPAKLFTVVRTVDEMCEALSLGMRYLIIGKGSNCLFDDAGFDGLVILNKIDFLEQEGGQIYVGSGYSFSRLGALTARNGWKGLEFASGIPGTVGGAVFMNAGAGDSQTCDVLTEVEFVSERGRKVFNRSDLEFSYRTSPFQSMTGAIVSARFRVEKCQDAKQHQLDLVRYRTSTQPYGEKTCGCVFRNPGQEGAGALIEKCGLKGLSVGDMEVSLLHANFLVNKGQGTADQALKLIEKIQSIVKEKTGYELAIEVRRIGI
ncbi:MAG TPA: UDP-N-acetylmuramate dehydrogenase [Chlamydiales bacterium]|nr:UDP-N-acetylmuramate dehydrogenase [Chlamydiales bacterium]